MRIIDDSKALGALPTPAFGRQRRRQCAANRVAKERYDRSPDAMRYGRVPAQTEANRQLPPRFRPFARPVRQTGDSFRRSAA